MYAEQLAQTIQTLVETEALIVEPQEQKFTIKVGGKKALPLADFAANPNFTATLHGNDSISELLIPLSRAYGKYEVSGTEQLLTQRLLEALCQLNYGDCDEIDINSLWNKFRAAEIGKILVATSSTGFLSRRQLMLAIGALVLLIKGGLAFHTQQQWRVTLHKQTTQLETMHANKRPLFPHVGYPDPMSVKYLHPHVVYGSEKEALFK